MKTDSTASMQKYIYIYTHTQRKPLHYTKHCARRCGHERRNSKLLWFYPWHQRSGRKLKDHNRAENEGVPQFRVYVLLGSQKKVAYGRAVIFCLTLLSPTQNVWLLKINFLFLRTKLYFKDTPKWVTGGLTEASVITTTGIINNYEN